MHYNERCTPKQEMVTMDRSLYTRTEGRNSPIDIMDIRNREHLKLIKFEINAVNEDYLEEQFKLELDTTEKDFRDILFDAIYEIREWIGTEEGLHETASSIAEDYDISLLKEEDFYAWVMAARDSDYMYLTECLLNCMTVGSLDNYNKNMRNMINAIIKNEYNIDIPFLMDKDTNKSLRFYMEHTGVINNSDVFRTTSLKYIKMEQEILMYKTLKTRKD